MKKTFLLTLALLISAALNAQTIINESFDSSEMPQGWTIMGEALTNWSISATNMAGGEANEAKLGWSPEFIGVTRLVAVPVDLTGIKSLKINFDHYFHNYASAISTIGVATSSDNGTTWNTGWSCDYNVTGKYSIEQKIQTTDMGKENVLLCIFFDGSSPRFQAWYFDNIVVTAQSDTEIRLNSIDIYDRIGAGNLKVNFTVQNMGNNAINSFMASYEIEGQDLVKEVFSTSMASFEEKSFTFNTTKNIIPGEYDINIDIIEVNGVQDDASDNSLSKDFNVSISNRQRIPMIEHFSSSMCAPCVLINQLMHNLTEENPGKYTYSKFVVDIPPPGDPYYTEDCRIRKEYYAVHSVPRVHLDAELQVVNSTAQPVTQSALMERYNEPAFVEIRGAFNIDENNIITITADVASYVNLENVRTFITVNEKTTTENRVEYGGTGETEWHHIVMKEMGDGDGIETSVNAGKYQRFEYTYDMNSTFMEESDDLEVAVWVQNYETQEIFNSHYLYEYTDHPYPVRNLSVTAGNRLKIKWDAPEKGNPTGYNLYINNELILNNTKETSFSIDMTDYCIVEVVALYENGKTSVGAVKVYPSEDDDEESIEEINDDKISIYPNPAKDEIYISSNERIEEVTVYNVNGQQTIAISQQLSANSCTINIANLNSGIYIIKINTNKENIVKRFIKY